MPHRAVRAIDIAGTRSRSRRFGVAVALLALSLLATWIAAPLLAQTTLLLLWPAVIAATIYSGFGTGVVVAAMGIIIIDLWLVPVAPGELRGSTILVPLALFAVVTFVISLLARAVRAEHARALEAESEAAARAEQLADQAMELEAQLTETNQITEELEASAAQMEQLTVEAEEARDIAERAREEISSAFDAIPDSIAMFDQDLHLRYINPVGRGILESAGYDVDSLVGASLDEGIGPAGVELAGVAREAIAGGRMLERQQYVGYADRWFGHRFVPMHSGLLLISRDITRDLRTATDRQLMATAGALLAEARLDPEETLANLARAVVPEFGDWCSIQMIEEDGSLRQLAVAHVDPAKARWARELNERYPPDPDAPAGAAHVARTGRSELFREIPEELLVRSARDEEHLRLIRSVGIRSAIAVPIIGNDRVIGVLSIVSAESGRRYGEHDVTTAEELGRRAGLAVENARLYAAEKAARSVAESAADRTSRLQRVTAALSRATSPGDVGRVVVTEGVAALGASAGAIWTVNQRRGTLDLLRAVGIGAGEQSRFRRVPLDESLPIVDALKLQEPLVMRSREEIAARYPEAAGQLTSLAPESWLISALQAHDGPLGVMTFGFPEAREFEADTLNFFEALANQCATAMERARLMAAEQRARAEAEKANRVKTDFLTVMSHELRTPLNAIAGHAELLELAVHGPVTDAQKEALTRIRRSQRHLLGLINDVLNFAKLEAGHVSYDIRAVPVKREMDALEPFVSPQIAAKGLRYRCAAPSDLVVLADAEKLRQILLNLLSNAVKFTPDGGEVELNASAAESAAEAVIEVRDTGIGIPEDQLEQVFAPFVQVGRGLTSIHEGTGLGLAISRDLAEGMGGSLTVESIEGEGSRFTLTLPRATTGSEKLPTPRLAR